MLSIADKRSWQIPNAKYFFLYLCRETNGKQARKTSHCYDKLDLYSLWRKWTSKIKTSCPSVWLVCLMWFTEGLLNIVNWLYVVRQKVICILLILFSCLIRTFHSSFRIVISFCRGLLHILFTVVRFPCRAQWITLLMFRFRSAKKQQLNLIICKVTSVQKLQNKYLQIFSFWLCRPPKSGARKNRYWKRRKPHRKP